MLYMTNDDTGIQNYLNGFTSGINDPNHQFISIFLGYPLSILYRLFPTIQWWFAYSQGLMLIGICEGIYVYKFQRLNSTDKDSKD